MGTALCHVRQKDGSCKQVLIRNFPSGDRNWYHDPEHCRFFTEAQRKGLQIHRAKLGLGELKMMDAAQLYRIGCELCREDPSVIT